MTKTKKKTSKNSWKWMSGNKKKSLLRIALFFFFVYIFIIDGAVVVVS